MLRANQPLSIGVGCSISNTFATRYLKQFRSGEYRIVPEELSKVTCRFEGDKKLGSVTVSNMFESTASMTSTERL